MIHRQKKPEINLLTLEGTLIKERANLTGIDFGMIMQADFVCYLKCCFDYLRSGDYVWWHPSTTLYAAEDRKPFEMFARSKSINYFHKVCPIFSVANKAEFEKIGEGFVNNKIPIPKWEFRRLYPNELMGLKDLATIP